MKLTNADLFAIIQKLDSSIFELESKYLVVKHKQNQLPDFRRKWQHILKQHIENAEWKDLIYKFSGEYTLLVFLLIQERLTPKTYWSLLGKVLTSEVYYSDYKREILSLLNNTHKNISLRDRIMKVKEREIFNQESRKIVYRGCLKKFKEGISWTFDPKEAFGFASRNVGISYVYKAEIEKSDVLAFFEPESEILISPKKLKNITPVIKLTTFCSVWTSDSYHRTQRNLARSFLKENMIFNKIIRDIINN